MPQLPLSSGDILQEATGTANSGSSVQVSLPAGTQAGKTVIILVQTSTQDAATPSGFVMDQATSDFDGLFHFIRVFRRSNTSAAEGPWTISSASGSGPWTWWAMEVDRFDLASPKLTGSSAEISTNTVSPGFVSTASTGNMLRNDTLVLGMLGLRTDAANFAGFSFGAAKPDPYDPHTNLGSLATTNASGSVNLYGQRLRSFPYPDAQGIDFARDVNEPTEFGTSSRYYVGVVVVYASADSSVPDPLDFCTGFEFGTHGGLTAAPLAARRIVASTAGTWGTNFLIQSASARSGTYGLRIVQSAVAAYLRWDWTKLDNNNGAAAPGQLVAGFGVKIVSSTGIVVLAEINPTAGTIAQLVYNTTNTQLGIRWGSGGTVSYQSGTTATGTFVWVDWKVTGINSATWAQEWMLNGVDQEAPVNLTGQTASTFSSMNVGGNVAQTVTIDIDDLCLGSRAAAYPIGKTKVVLCTVDTGGTLTVTGSTANLNTFSANGTLAAWNATTARGAIDEVPPTISTSADGLVQITAATGTYVTIPMATYTLATGEIIHSVMAMFALWANSAQTASLELAGNNGQAFPTWLTTGTLFNPGSTAQPASATVPMWVHGKFAQGAAVAYWTQTSLNAVVLDVGKSNDATPDIGIHVCYLEIAVAEATSSRIYGPDEDGMTVDVTRSGGNYAVESYFVDCGPTRGATLRYVQDGTEVVKTIAANATLTENVSSNQFDAVSRVTIEPDPEVL